MVYGSNLLGHSDLEIKWRLKEVEAPYHILERIHRDDVAEWNATDLLVEKVREPWHHEEHIHQPWCQYTSRT